MSCSLRAACPPRADPSLLLAMMLPLSSSSQSSWPDHGTVAFGMIRMCVAVTSAVVVLKLWGLFPESDSTP